MISSSWIELYPAKKYDRTQRMGRGLPNEWGRRYPAAGYKTAQPLGIKYMKKDIKMMLIY